VRFIEEIVVEEFLPTFRSMLATDLRGRGLTQTDVATLLGVSQSAVSKYAQGKVNMNTQVRNDDRVRALVSRLGSGLTDGSMEPVQALTEAEVLVRQLEHGDVLARLHESAFPPLTDYEGDFAIHDPDSRPRTAARVLASVRQGLRILETTSGFARVIPAVGSNLVEAVPEAQGIADVAAVPGRILDIKGRATVPSDPEFGVSEHVATVLLAAQAAGSTANAAINVRYTSAIVTALAGESKGVEFDAEGSVETAITKAVTTRPGATVLYQAGGFGVEPIVYVLAEDAVTAAERVRELADHGLLS
jgi:predicted fused transcriptional regulator/phosphomethylpyrimidine kinase/predicted transcriptional regulator